MADTPQNNAPAGPHSGGKKTSARGEFIESVKTVAVALLIAVAIKTVIFQPFTIPSESEEPNLFKGDYIIVSKWDYGYSYHSILFSPPLFGGRIFFSPPKRGDVVVFKFPAHARTGYLKWPQDRNEDYIKRLVGLPGDRVQVRDGVLYINDKPLPTRVEKSLKLNDHRLTAPEMDEREGRWLRETNPEGRSYLTQQHAPYGQMSVDNTDVYVVPPHCYFMMGDNRENSLDSRFDPLLPPGDKRLHGCEWDSRWSERLPSPEPGVGLVPEEDLVGRARFVLLAWQPDTELFKPWTWLNFRFDHFFRGIT